MSVFEKLGHIDNRIIYTLLIIALLTPLMKPIGLPISVSAHTRRSYGVIDKLKSGDVVVLEVGYSVSGAADVEPQTVAVLKHLFGKGVKIIFTSVQTDGPMITETLMKPYETQGKKYGDDFCILGYLAGGENAISAYGQDIKKAYPVDFRGNPTSSLPILKGITGAKDLDAFLFFTSQNSDMYVRQISQYKIPLVGGLVTTISPQAEPYVNSGQLSGMLVGLRGGAEYETMMKQPGLGVASMDAQSMGHLLMIAFILFANISYFATRKDEKSKGGAA